MFLLVKRLIIYKKTSVLGHKGYFYRYYMLKKDTHKTYPYQLSIPDSRNSFPYKISKKLKNQTPNLGKRF